MSRGIWRGCRREKGEGSIMELGRIQDVRVSKSMQKSGEHEISGFP